jgi:hypothetical protein
MLNFTAKVFKTKKPPKERANGGFKFIFRHYLSLNLGQDLAPFHIDGCQGFTGPDPSAFLDNLFLKNYYN